MEEKKYTVSLTQNELLIIGRLRAKKQTKQVVGSFVAWAILSLVVLIFGQYPEIVEVIIVAMLFCCWLIYAGFQSKKTERQTQEFAKQYLRDEQ